MASERLGLGKDESFISLAACLRHVARHLETKKGQQNFIQRLYRFPSGFAPPLSITASTSTVRSACLHKGRAKAHFVPVLRLGTRRCCFVRRCLSRSSRSPIRSATEDEPEKRCRAAGPIDIPSIAFSIQICPITRLHR
ncbi:hypothetical protein LI328DRAFT_158227 [Trichoderma asperelloides]|nr:hypothetical protein LI328DRAFT_158227 [Trichoderma asperelloides]